MSLAAASYIIYSILTLYGLIIGIYVRIYLFHIACRLLLVWQKKFLITKFQRVQERLMESISSLTYSQDLKVNLVQGYIFLNHIPIPK